MALARKGYSNRSEAIRDLIRDELVEKEWASDDEEVAGTITLVYDHHIKGPFPSAAGDSSMITTT
jgi:CopG family transcriptional regulator, nickel-responsive regulator